MEENHSPPPGGAAETQNPEENPRAFQQGSENTLVPQESTQNPSTPSPTTYTYDNPLSGWDVTASVERHWDGNSIQTTSAPPPPPSQTGIPHYNIQVIENTDSPLVNPTETRRKTEVTIATRPQTPPPQTTAEDEDDLMQDIRLAIQTQGQPSKPAQQDSPTTRVSTGTWKLPKLPGSEIEKPTIENPLKTPEVTQGSSKSPGTSDGTPHLVTPPAKDSPPKKVTYADTTKGATLQIPPFQQTICEIEDDEANIRTPPPTDVTFSVWVDLTKTTVSHSDLKKMAGKHPNIKGAGWRKEAQWVEFYCGSAKDVENLINNPVKLNDTSVTFIKARKLYGDKLVLKLANINPSPGENLIRETLMTALGKVALVEKVAPVYLKPEEGCPEEDKLCTRRWNALVYVQPDKRFIVHPTFQMHGTTVVITWKGSTCSVCHHCKEAGHWTEKCTPTHRTLAAQKRMRKLEPSPLPQKTPVSTEEHTEKPAEQGTSKDTPKLTDPPKTKPDTKGKGKQTEEKTPPPVKKSSAVIEEEAMEESKKAFAEEGFYILSSGDEAPKSDDPKKTDPQKKETPTRKYTQERQVRKLTSTNVSTRARSKGTLPDYALYLLRVGMTTPPKANELLANTKPEEFIEITRPGMSKQLYANFGKFVDRRKNDTEANTIDELKAYKVSIPECYIPGNANFVDTSVAPKTDPKRKRRKSESTVAADSSAEERSVTAQPITHVNVQYIDDEGKDATFKLKFTRNMCINTLAKAIMKKKKITARFRLLRKSDSTVLDLQQTALEAKLQDNEVIILDKTLELGNDEEMEEESNVVHIRFLQKGASKIWSKDFPYNTSTTNMYMEFAQHIKKRHTAFTLYRSDGTPVNRYTNVENLNIRHLEILREGSEEVVPMDINWIDLKKQHQHKPSFIPESTHPANAHWHIKHELGLEFKFEVETDEANLVDLQTIKEVNEEMTSNRLYLRRTNQKTWDDRDYQEEYDAARIIVRHSPTSDAYSTFEITNGMRIIDIVEKLAEENEQLRGKIIQDVNNNAYRLMMDLYTTVLTGVTLNTHLSEMNSYPTKDIQNVIRAIAVHEETTVEVLVPERFQHLIPLL